jgi:DNA polymerase III epsilon subunit-like protein
MSIETFFESVTVLDTETTHLLPDQAEIVEIAAARRNQQSWFAQGQLLNARNGIPPAASAKNNISPKMIAYKPYFDQSTNDIKELLNWNGARYFVAHNVNYDREVLKTAWQRIESIADRKICEDRSRWICTWRLSRQILAHDFNDIEYGLNYLRYLLDLPVDDSIAVHRAADDSMMCALLLEYLTRKCVADGYVQPDADIGAYLHRLCWSPITLNTWPMGKYRGVSLTDIPTDYYVWALKNLNSLNEKDPGYDADLASSVAAVLEKRLENE